MTPMPRPRSSAVASPSATARSWHWTAWTWRCRPAACSASWVRTGRARRPRCASWPRWARADAGTARVAGLAVGDGAPNRAGLIGYLDQDPRFYGWMTPRDLLGLVGKLHGMDGAALRERIDATLATVGLADAARRSIGGFSGGMRQRLGLAQAILNRPPVLLLDEPVSSLDPQGRHDMLETIRGLGGEATVLFSTHILNDVERVCDRVAIIDHGRSRHRQPHGRAAGPLRHAHLRGRDRARRRRHARLAGRMCCARSPA